jgi:uncharacterized protein
MMANYEGSPFSAVMRRCVVCPTERSKAKVSPVNIGDVKVAGFWGDKMRINREVSIPTLYKNFLKYGTVDNFRILSGEKEGNITRRLATDSDLYKWMEAVSYDLLNQYDEERARLLDNLVSLIGKVQEKTGYINTFYTGGYRKNRLKNLLYGHELYCGGHLIQSAIAHYRATGKDRFLNIAVRWADFISNRFGNGKIEENDGHPEVEMALVELYRLTGKERYLQLAGFFMSKPYKLLAECPFLKIPEITGHAVRMMYLCSGATDYYAETGDGRYLKRLVALWDDMAEKKVYITGGVGSRYDGEMFGMPYELPNLRAYAESCAAVALMMWNYRMFLLTGESKFMDLFETTLYNGFLSGVSLNGMEYFYRNPLSSQGNDKRSTWYSTTCCPPNIQRMIASLPGYFYGVNREGIWINLYGESEAIIGLHSGNKVRISQKTDYPLKGRVSIELSPQKMEKFSVFLRIPKWADKSVIRFNSRSFIAEPGKYFVLKDLWGLQKKGRVDINFDLKPVLYKAHPEIESTKNSVAIKRGPVLYCFEGIDNPDINLFGCRLGKTKLKDRFEKKLLGGVYTISGEILNTAATDLPLYDIEERYPEIRYKKKYFKAVPYHCWANREKSRMVVWLSR